MEMHTWVIGSDPDPADPADPADVLGHVAHLVGSFLNAEDRNQMRMAHRRFADAHVSKTEQTWNVTDAGVFMDQVGRKVSTVMRLKPRLTKLNVFVRTRISVHFLYALANALRPHTHVHVMLVFDADALPVSLHIAASWWRRRVVRSDWCVAVSIDCLPSVRAVLRLLHAGAVFHDITALGTDVAVAIVRGVLHKKLCNVRQITVDTRAPAAEVTDGLTESEIDKALSTPDFPSVVLVNTEALFSHTAALRDIARLSTLLMDGTILLHDGGQHFGFIAHQCVRLHQLRMVLLGSASALSLSGPDAPGGYIVAQLLHVLTSMPSNALRGNLLLFEQVAVEDPSVIAVIRQMLRAMIRVGQPVEPRLQCGCLARRVGVVLRGTPAQVTCARIIARHVSEFGGEYFVVVPSTYNELANACVCASRADPVGCNRDTYEHLLESLAHQAPHLYDMWGLLKRP